MIQLTITGTAKSYHPVAGWYGMGEQRQDFPDMKSALTYLKGRYGNCSREKMYIDRKDETAIHCGWIYGFRNSDISHYPVERWLQRDWVSFHRLEPIDLNA